MKSWRFLDHKLTLIILTNNEIANTSGIGAGILRIYQRFQAGKK